MTYNIFTFTYFYLIKVSELTSKLKDLETKLAQAKVQALEELISSLPEKQRLLIKTCIDCSKVKDPRQRRYDIDWIYECLLMRIRGKALYEHMREICLLPLPCRNTLLNCINKVDTSYGFQQSIFDCLKLKSSRMEIVDKQGTLNNFFQFYLSKIF